ncbi:MAG: phosphatase PAP2 family protein [Bacilli bacterium]|nr:phosphatase PAP2 family protein [Bacilli bacterium]
MNEQEIQVLQLFRSLSNPFLDSLFRIISFLGEQYFVIAVIFVIFFLIDKKMGYRICYAILTGLCFNNTIKCFVMRPRPWVVDSEYTPAPNALKTATGYSFPSGHTQNISTLSTSVAINFKKKIITIIAIVLVVLVGFSRLFLGVHYPTDVLGGLIVGVSISILCNIIYRKVEDDANKQILTFFVTLAVFTPFVFIFFRKDYELMYWNKDFYTAWFMLLGVSIASIIDLKVVQIEVSKKFTTNLFRFLGAVVVLAITYIGLKLFFKLPIFPQEGNSFKIIFDGIRYFALGFNCLGLYPLIFKNVLFKKEQ